MKMKKFFIAFIFLLCTNIVFAGDITQFVFTNDQRTVKPNEAALLTAQVQYIGDSHPTACMLVSSNSGTGQFSSNDTNWNAVDKLTINSNWTIKNFYYKDSAVGIYTITAKIVPGVSCSTMTNQEVQFTAEQSVVVSDGSSGSTTVVEPQTQLTTVVGSSTSWPVEPQIYADAGADKTAVAGADIIFTGKALGLDKKPLDGARYLWSFGDGASAEGKSVKHFYKYPGEYIVFLNVSNTEYSAGDGALVKIIPNQLKIIEANSDFIKLKNDSSATLDITGWFLRNGDSLPAGGFKFPQTTLIKNGATLIIDSSISGINAKDGKAELLYPNGSPAISYATQTSQTTTVVGSKIEPEPKTIKHSVSSSFATNTENQTASAISSVQDDGENSNTGKWLALASGMGVISAAGLIFIRRKGLL
ncbi:MAG: PKD domain-containing protein [Candidatus Paceibacterota bacterium]